MPILAMSSGQVTALWGTAFVISPDGRIKSIKVGDNVDQGAQILTSVDGIVQLSPDKGASVLIKAVTSDADKVITGLDRDAPDLTPTAGLTGGTDSGLVPGLRVDRVVESVGQLEFSFGTERVPPAQPVGRAADSNGVSDAGPVPDTNLMIVLDISASMSEPSGIDGLTRLQAAVKSIDNLIDQYADVGGLAVRLVTFSNTSETQGDSWVTAAQAKNLLDGLVANGNTNYDYALSQAQAAFATAAGKLTGAQNVSYFFSDGDPTLSSTNPDVGKKGQNGGKTQPNLGDGIDVAEEAAWIAFLDANQIKSHAIGLGTGIAKTYLNPIAHDGQTKEDLDGTVVTSLNQLDSTLDNTYQGALSGSLLIKGTTTALMGVDVFAWRFSDHGALAPHHSVDRITDFDLAVPSAGGDTLDLRDLLQGESAGNLQNYLEFDTSTANTTETDRIVLDGVNLRTGLGTLGAGATDAQIVAKMLEQGKLLVDLV